MADDGLAERIERLRVVLRGCRGIDFRASVHTTQTKGVSAMGAQVGGDGRAWSARPRWRRRCPPVANTRQRKVLRAWVLGAAGGWGGGGGGGGSARG
jgi:hypothetical protein